MKGLEHLSEEFRHVASLPNTKRIDFLNKSRWIGYPAARSILGILKVMLELPKRPRMPNLLIIGEPNNGKTTLVYEFRRRHGQGYVNEQVEPVKPVIVAEAPPTADEKSLYLSILDRFAAPHQPGSPTSKLRYQAIHLLKACGTRMLVFDEFHSLLTGTMTRQRQVMNAIKLLCNELVIPIVGVGTWEARQVLHTDAQHASRFDYVELPNWTSNAEFRQLLVSFESILPLRKPSNIQHPKLARLIYSISGGKIGDVHRVLRECATTAIQSGTEQIDEKIIKDQVWVKPDPETGVRRLPI